MIQESGASWIPYECYRVVLPFGEIIQDIDVTLEDYTVLEGEFDMRCTQSLSPISAPVPQTPRNPDIYNRDERYPYEDYSLQRVERLSGVDIDDAVYMIAYVFSQGNTPCDIDGDDTPDC
jgi:hypothetical protein